MRTPAALLFLLACDTPAPESPPRGLAQIEPGAPVAGMADGLLDFPVGAPLGGYTGRCNCFGNAGEVDKRQSAYINNFNPSAGVQTRSAIQALWLENGQEDLVWTKIDAIYSYDGLVAELGERLTAATGHDVRGKVVVSANHTHHMPANYEAGLTWFLGGDRYNEEIFQRMVASIEAVALAAFEGRVPAALGLGIAKDWDPDDRVYRDRRPENDTLGFFDDIPDGPYKDPYLYILRVDTAAGDPMGMFFAHATHGTMLGGDNQLWSRDASAGLEVAVAEQFDRPLVIAHVQTGGGDSSPAGVDREWAALESIGEFGVDAVMALYESTPTSTAPIRLETVSHGISQAREDIRVTRGGTVDLYYAPVNPDGNPDDIIYGPDGELLSPIDEINVSNGAAFCGDDNVLIPGTSVGSEVFPYNSCVDVTVISAVIASFFDVPDYAVELPLIESRRAQVSASRVGPLAIREADGSTSQDDVLFGFFPGEPTALYTEQFRRRAQAELGYDHAIPIGYAQDHEGYLLVPEDWLKGGYEPNINIWGPLQAEYLMEGVFDIAERWLATDAIEPQDPAGDFPISPFPPEPLPNIAPDLTPLAGTPLDAVPEYLYVPLPGLTIEVAPPAVVARGALVQFAWEGGDPGVDLPHVVIERLEGSAWVPVSNVAGRIVSEADHDILLVHTPDPLYPYTDPQSHAWWAVWQVVGHFHDRVGVPAGTYRFAVSGHSAVDGAETWPWPAEEYQLTSEPFEVVPATVQATWDGATLSAWIDAPAAGYRLIDLEGYSQGRNPVRGVTLTWTLADGSVQVDSTEGSIGGQVTSFALTPPDGAVAIDIVDAYGNAGRVTL